MSRLRALIVDDEPLAVRRLAHSLAAFDDIEVVDCTTSARRAVQLIDEHNPDIVFLDIAMPGLGGFDVAARVPARLRPAIIFVTAYDRYAVRAFDTDAADYLMKPVAPDRLAAALEKARTWLRGRRSVASESADKLGAQDSLWVHRRGEFIRVPIGGIEWIEAEGDYVRLHADNGGGLMRETLTHLADRLDPNEFIRVHRSAICRTRAITGLRRKATGALTVQLVSGGEAPVGRRYVSGLRALLTKVRGIADEGRALPDL
ncbi:LytTR family DNA-binding domain-containing protein [Sphingosinicella sp. LHD-64]|uniref:LytR/AlgR family response regulator transcription factor n=1 Tax=Sphingosinicella sp. LHD-64 TaxID=3072139 RepID=UPI00280C5752|nr:LytTR family DNA-binding domain-containing protein [Sphingosinicella sp. LHD-64]MDQ8755778.1 LytTR family DNA-binding domain-containing protein [Sphingosinicella sp. LHD-64]